MPAHQTRKTGPTIPIRICGIPAQAKLTHFLTVPRGRGPAHTYDSDWDYLGWEELEYDILDRRGYPAPWLERKLTEQEAEKVRETIHQFINDAGELK